MSIYINRSFIREACVLLRDNLDCPFNFLSDVTCVDWFPREPRFEVIYHLLSIPKKERVRQISSSAKFTICLEFASSVIAISGVC